MLHPNTTKFDKKETSVKLFLSKVFDDVGIWYEKLLLVHDIFTHKPSISNLIGKAKSIIPNPQT